MPTVAVIGGGPAGLIAAEKLAEAGIRVIVYDRKPSLARKFLMAGRGGLNLTHSEDLTRFLARYGASERHLAPFIGTFTPASLREWCEGLGEAVFVGSSGRVFPKSMKASPLLRAWQLRLAKLGVEFCLQFEWRGWNDKGALVFVNAEGIEETTVPSATLLALGGASWPRLGSDGSWTKYLTDKGIAVSPLRPSNCGFTVNWSDVFRSKYSGQPIKPVVLSFGGQRIAGEAMLTEKGIEGGAVYALSAPLREMIAKAGSAVLHIDLKPGLEDAELTVRLQEPRRGRSLSNFLRQEVALSPAAIGLLQENQCAKTLSAAELAALIKSFPVELKGTFEIDRAISSAGGIAWDEVDGNLMLRKHKGMFAAGEMLDWEAPTGGYLLQACFSTGVAAAHGIMLYLNDKSSKTR